MIKPSKGDASYDPGAMIPGKTSKSSSTILKRLKLCFNEDRIYKLLEKIEKDISKIDALTRGHIELEPLRRKRQQDTSILNWQNIRNHAKRLYGALSSLWLCDGGHEHRADLKLQTLDDEHLEELAAFRFTLVFPLDELAIMASQGPSRLCQVEIETCHCQAAKAYVT